MASDCAALRGSNLRHSIFLASEHLVSLLEPITSANKMLSILRKARLRDKEMRILMLYVGKVG